jgi:hypothetical protein
MKTQHKILGIIGFTALLSSCSSIYKGNLSGGDDLYSVKETAVPLGESINDDLSYASYKYQKQQDERQQNNQNSQNTVYSNNYNNFYSPYYNYNNNYYGMSMKHPMYSFGYSNYGYNSFYGYPGALSYGYSPYYGWGTYPSTYFGMGYSYGSYMYGSPYGVGYGYNPYYGFDPYGYNSYGYGYNPYGYGYNPYGYGYNPYGYGYNPYHNPYGSNGYYGNNGGYYGNVGGNSGNSGSSNQSTGIHYSGPRSNNSGGGVVTRRDVPNTVGLTPISQGAIVSSKENTTKLNPNTKLTDGLTPQVTNVNRMSDNINPVVSTPRQGINTPTRGDIQVNTPINTPINVQPQVISPVRDNSIFRPSSVNAPTPNRSIEPARGNFNIQETPASNNSFSAPEINRQPQDINRGNFNINNSSPRPAGNFNSGGGFNGGNSGGRSGNSGGGSGSGGGNMRGR